MNIAIEDSGKTSKTVTIDFSSEEISKECGKLLKEFSAHAKIPGFRPGKAPANMIKSRYIKEIKEDLSRRVISKAYDGVLADEKMDIYSIMNIDSDNIDPDGVAKIIMEVEIYPEFTLPEYAGINLELASTDATAEDLTEAETKLREQRASYDVVERVAEKGDYVRCSYEGKIGDKLISEIVPDRPIYSAQSSTWEEAGSENSPGVRAIVDGIIGMKADDKQDVTMEFPADFEEAALAGKKAIYSLEVSEVREKKLPEVDEEFFKANDVENKEGLEEKLKKEIVSTKENANRSSKQEQVVKFLLDNVEMALPEQSVEQKKQQFIVNMMSHSMQQGATQEDMEARKDEINEEALKAASNKIKLDMILEKVAKDEKIKVEKEDISHAIMNEAIMARTSPEKLIKEMRKDQQQMSRLRTTALMQKTMEFIVNKAEITTK